MDRKQRIVGAVARSKVVGYGLRCFPDGVAVGRRRASVGTQPTRRTRVPTEGQGSDNGRDVSCYRLSVAWTTLTHLWPLDRFGLEADIPSVSPVLTLKADMQGCWQEVAVERCMSARALCIRELKPCLMRMSMSVWRSCRRACVMCAGVQPLLTWRVRMCCMVSEAACKS